MPPATLGPWSEVLRVEFERKKALAGRLRGPLDGVLHEPPFIVDGTLDRASRIVQQIRRQYCIPVFVKTFGSDVACATEQDGDEVRVFVVEEGDAADGADAPHFRGGLIRRRTQISPDDFRAGIAASAAAGALPRRTRRDRNHTPPPAAG